MEQSNLSLLVSRFGKRKLFIAAGIVLGLFLLLLFAIFAWQYEEKKVDSYDNALSEWRHSHRKQLIDQVVVPENLFTFADSDSITKPLLEQQTTACAGVVRTLEKVDEHIKAMPVLDGGILSGMSSRYRKAEKASQDKIKTLRAYHDDVRKTFTKMADDCRWTNQLARERLELYPNTLSTTKLLIEPGKTDQRLICQQKPGCLPTNTTKAKQYANAFTKSAVKESEIVIAAFGDPCQTTTIKSLCDTYKKAWEQYKTKQVAYTGALKSAKKIQGDAKIKKALQALLSDKSRQKIFTEATEAFPQLKFESNVTEDTLTPETIFRTDTVRRLATLKKQSVAISRL